MRRSQIIATAVLASAVVGWALFRPERLFVNRTVSETFPGDTPSATATGASTERAVKESPAAAETMTTSRDSTVALVRGEFHSNAHETRGVAAVYRLGDGRRVLRLTDFMTSNGPDVRIYLVAAADVQDPDVVKRAGFVDLGGMKGNIGDQNYEVPSDLDLSKYRSVSIWCRRFSVNFGAAPLSATP